MNHNDNCNDPHKLLRDLRRGRDLRFAPAVIISADAGVDGTERHGKGKKFQESCAAGIEQYGFRQKRGKMIHTEGGAQGKRERQSKAADQVSAAVFFALFSVFRGYETGERRLDAAAAQRKTDAVHGIDQLIQSHGFRTDFMGKKNPVKKSGNPCDQSGSSQKQGAEDQWISASVGGHGRTSDGIIISIFEGRRE